MRENAQAYVIYSRVQSLSQLFIIESVCAEKITASMSALGELERMELTAVNLKPIDGNLILSCNIRSIKKNLDHLLTSSFASHARLLCLQETWLDPTSNYDISGKEWSQHCNSAGRGKGISSFYKQPYTWISDIKRNNYQFTKLASEKLDVINIYRSDGANTNMFLEDLMSMINDKRTLIMGDFNLCFQSENLHPIFQCLRKQGFCQLVKSSTHIKGRMIDLVFINQKEELHIWKSNQQPTFFSDHDVIQISSG